MNDLQQPKKAKTRKRRLPTSFLDSPSLVQVVGFPSTANKQTNIITTQVASDVVKEIFLERFVKEIVRPFRPTSISRGDTFVMVDGRLKKRKVSDTKTETPKSEKQSIWKERVKIGTNQCLRALESANPEEDSSIPSLLVMARDIYPPTMLSHAPVIAEKLGIPILMLPGKASTEIGEAIGIKKTSILLFLPSAGTDAPHMAVNSFVEFMISHIPTSSKP